MPVKKSDGSDLPDDLFECLLDSFEMMWSYWRT
jgi:hypothetical protein